MKREEIEYIMDLDRIEDKCIAIRIKSTIVFAYPVCREVLEMNPKVITRDGVVVKNVQPAMRDGNDILVGVIEGGRVTWDAGGRYAGDTDHEMDLYVPERYFDRYWRDKIKMSNGEWAVRYQKAHPYAEIPKKNSQRPWGI